ncbi:fibrinogen-like protein 1 [Saccostrea cucullata]|uniref:fibrinogen-like protein 1 n=1 Tax=Saccostrea cuccullata TaxID=36930 RepID=UPI002ED06F78
MTSLSMTSYPVTLEMTSMLGTSQSVTLETTSLSMTTTLYDPNYPWNGDCSNVLGGGPPASNVYTIIPSGAPGPISVYCDVKPEGVFTRIMEHGGNCGVDDWNLPMSDYISGFGQDVSCDHWIGLQNMFYLTNTISNYKLEINIRLENGNNDSIHYGSFLVKDPTAWTLRLDSFSGSTNNYLGNGFDNLPTASSADLIDNEDFEANGVNVYGCSGGDKSGWWFSPNCLNTNLCLPLGQVEKALYPTTRQILWPELSGNDQVVKHVTMQIRKTN